MYSDERVYIRSEAFWAGLAFGLRWLLALTHFLFAIPFIIRPHLPDLYPSFAAFNDSFSAQTWGVLSLIASLLLLVMPTRVPLGLVSTAASTYLMLVVGLTFAQGAGLIPGTVIYIGVFSAAGLVLFMRTLWLYMVKVEWFQRLMHWRELRDKRQDKERGNA